MANEQGMTLVSHGWKKAPLVVKESGFAIRHQGLYVLVDCCSSWSYCEIEHATIFKTMDALKEALQNSGYDEVLADSDEPAEFPATERTARIELLSQGTQTGGGQ